MDVNDKTILKYIFDKRRGKMWTTMNWTWWFHGTEDSSHGLLGYDLHFTLKMETGWPSETLS